MTKNLFIVANWKANKNEQEAILWLAFFKDNLAKLKGQFEHKEIIVCPPYPLLSPMKKYIVENELPIKLGSQDISQFGRGPYTGEVPVSIVTQYMSFVIIGHSERRIHFKEDDNVFVKKTSAALSEAILPIYCVQNENTFIPNGVKIVAYEPVEAIGTGNPDTPENAERVTSIIKSNHKDVMHVLYGGSVTDANVGSFTTMEHIDGVLVGGSSLDQNTFINLLKAC